MKIKILYSVSALSGVAIWLFMRSVSDIPGPWEGSLYFYASLPMHIALSIVLGFIEPKEVIRWPALSAVSHAFPLFVQEGIGNLWPISLVTLLLIFLIPSVICSYIGVLLRLVTNKLNQ